MRQIVQSLDELKKKAIDGIDIAICFGIARSSKYIIYYEEDNRFYIWHYIDNTEEEISEGQLLRSNIGRALRKKVLIYDE